MTILIAPDKFKGSLSASEAAEAIRDGLGDLASSCSLLPIADGGEGTAEALCAALGGEMIETVVHGPLGPGVQVRYALVDNGATAVMEMSQASGLWRLAEGERNAVQASTFGTGEMICDALTHRVSRIVLGIGGSATNDGGSGMGEALGFRFLDKAGSDLSPLPAQLPQVARIEPTNLQIPEFITACDVENPLLGPLGATRVYGPQKGIDPADFELHEQRLQHLAELVKRDLGIDAADQQGAGAAGGLGFGTIAFCGATLRPGFDLVADLLDLEDKVRAADLVITGEGSLDAQTLHGKGPHGVAQLARKHGKPILAFAGKTDADPQLEIAFDRVEIIRPEHLSIEESMAQAQQLLAAAAARLKPWIRAQLPA